MKSNFPLEHIAKMAGTGLLDFGWRDHSQLIYPVYHLVYLVEKTSGYMENDPGFPYTGGMTNCSFIAPG